MCGDFHRKSPAIAFSPLVRCPTLPVIFSALESCLIGNDTACTSLHSAFLTLLLPGA